jgi:hypothetical protein
MQLVSQIPRTDFSSVEAKFYNYYGAWVINRYYQQYAAVIRDNQVLVQTLCAPNHRLSPSQELTEQLRTSKVVKPVIPRDFVTPIVASYLMSEIKKLKLSKVKPNPQELKRLVEIFNALFPSEKIKVSFI